MAECGILTSVIVCACGCLCCISLMEKDPCLPCDLCEAFVYSPEFRQASYYSCCFCLPWDHTSPDDKDEEKPIVNDFVRVEYDENSSHEVDFYCK